MYQGKFDAKSRGQQSPKETLSEILQERSAAKTAAQQPKPVKRPAAPKQSAAPAPARPQMARQPQPEQTPAVKEPVKQVPQPKQPAAKPKKRGPRLGGVIFYTLYFLMIFVFFAGMYFVLQWLHGWLGDYEAAQPTIKCQEVFDQLFKDPDWAQLYKDAGVEDTRFEGVSQFVTHMEEKVGDQELDFVETSAGLSGDKKYIVRLDGEKIATFTLEGHGKTITDIPDWNLGKVEVFFQRQQSYRIQKADGHTAYVNGQELDDDYTIQTVSTKVEKYLPVGTTGSKVCTQEITDLLCKPEVTIKNQAGENMEVLYDEATGTFAEQTIANIISDEEREVVLGALKSRAEFMINSPGGRAGVAKYYDGSSQIYSEIIKMAGELWMNHDYGHHFEDEAVTSYYRYTDNLFSARGSVKMVANLKDGNTRAFEIDSTLFFQKKNGKWVCYEMTNEDVSQPVGKVRLTFMNGSALLSSEFYDTNCQQLQTPVVSIPEGKVFSGWVRQDVDDSGRTTLTVVFTPDETGLVTMGMGASLEPMTLYALFENAPSAEGGAN